MYVNQQHNLIFPKVSMASIDFEWPHLDQADAATIQGEQFRLLVEAIGSNIDVS